MGPGRRACALALVLTMLGAIPLGAPRGCADCPPGCPMHAHGGSSPRLGCHHAPPAPEGATCFRSACGHDVLARADAVPPAIVHRGVRPRPITATHAVPARDARLASLFAPEPPTDPPRALRG